MKYIFVVEAISSGRYYVREAAERGCTPVVLFPRMAAEAAHYAPFRASVEKYRDSTPSTYIIWTTTK